jgi:glyoxylase-like metal-dependent hydrolase (beta-lactamase superfamily II)
MKKPNINIIKTFIKFSAQSAFMLLLSAVFSGGLFLTSSVGQIKSESSTTDADSEPYPDMPDIAPIGVRVSKYMDVPQSAFGPAIEPAKGYRIQELGKGLYLVTDNAYQSMFMVYEKGVVVIDAPQSYAQYIPKAIREVTDKPITHLVYSHSHADHIGGAKTLGAKPVIVAQEETKRLLIRANDPNRPLPTVTFRDRYILKVGSQRLELSYHGVAHEPGNIFIFAPGQKTLMVVDIVSPGWMPFRRLHLAQDVLGHYSQVEEMRKLDFETLVGGHVGRTGTKADVELYSEFLSDLKTAADESLKTTKFGVGLDPRDVSNPWAGYANYVDRVVVQCVNRMTPKWATKLAAYDVFIWDQCYTVEQSLQID